MKQETQQQTASTTTSQKVVSQQAQKSSASAIDKLKEFGGFAFLENIIEFIQSGDGKICSVMGQDIRLIHHADFKDHINVILR